MRTSKASRSKKTKSAPSKTSLPAIIVGLGLPMTGMALVVILMVYLWVSQMNNPAQAMSINGGVRFEPARDLSLPVLTGVDGSELTKETLMGHWTIVNFGYLSCPDICPVNMAAIHQALNQSPPSLPDNINVLYVTMDPARDSSEELLGYLSYFNPEYQGATGSVEEVSTFANEMGTVFENTPPDSSGFYSINHNSLLSVLNPDGKLAGQLIGTYDSDKLRKFLSELTSAI
ncbi:SCO family protein [Hahella ganghwensis]|uniref:SCO family protein n=1 Tax=Hahella ganghwensis TaxID=286420 RepID=UPI00037EB25A|nr:SCO family protein [Hahella ganghwensis]